MARVDPLALNAAGRFRPHYPGLGSNGRFEKLAFRGASIASEEPAPPLPADGLLAEWRFAEGAGTTVADEVGSYPINLATPTSPNVEWTATGVKLTAGLVQTPSIPATRTVAFLYKVTRNGTGYLTSGGNLASSAWTASRVLTAEADSAVGINGRITGIRRRLDNGTAANVLNRGGWVLGFRVLTQAYTTITGFGGEHSATGNRCATFDMRWAGVWNKVLSAEEKLQVLNALRPMAKACGIYLDSRDCPEQADVALIWGQSNADGRALIADLSAPDQAQTFTKTYILAADGTPRPTPPAAMLDLGVNQTVNSPSTQFGPETFIARWHEQNASRKLYMGKTAEGSTYLASEAESGVAGTVTWNIASLASGSLFHNGLTDAQDLIQSMLSAGVGIARIVVGWFQGEQDATQADCAASYQANMQALLDEMQLYLGSVATFVVGMIPSPGSVSMTETATVIAAQQAFVAANENAVLIDTSTGYATAVDNVHWNAASQKTLGTASAVAMFG